MGVDDFGLSVLASWIANKADTFFNPRPKEQEAPPPVSHDEEMMAERVRRFKTFDAWKDLDAILKTVRDPLISILIEDKPSTFYRLPSMVLESKATGEWFVFSRGRMSFEGSGGGIRNTRDILAQIKTTGAFVGVWVVPQNKLNDLDNGYELWPAIRTQAVPLLAVIAGEHSWAEIERNVSKYLNPESKETDR